MSGTLEKIHVLCILIMFFEIKLMVYLG